MNSRVRVNNLQDADVSPATLDLLARAVERAMELVGEHEGVVSLTLVDDATMAGLNLRYRGRQGPTDVLAFALEEGEWPALEGEEEVLLGDIVISAPMALAQARESLEDELLWLSVHGALHLLGYDHEDDAQQEAMDLKAREIIDSLRRAPE